MSTESSIIGRHPWLSALVAIVGVQIASSNFLKGATLIAFADAVQFAIMLLMVAGTAINIPHRRGPARGFWILMTVSAAMWAADYGFWVYYEIWRRVPMPSPQPGDILLVLHVVPMMMGMALLPHRQVSGEWLLASKIEVPIIACWWVYLYFQFVFVWQVISFQPAAFHRNFNLLYHAELAIVILACFHLSKSRQNGWSELFNCYLIGFVIYAPISAIINVLIQQGLYSSGGLWDLPLTIAIAYLAWIGFHARGLNLQPAGESTASEGLRLTEWLTSISAASIPAIALYSYEYLQDAPGVRHFRVALGFTAMLVLAVLIFTRQQLLNHRLQGSLADSRVAFDNLQRLQTQMMQSEKLAAIGQLVSGAAHELNNPLTAIMGYSELLATDEQVPTTQRGFAEKITQQARRTKNLVSNLLSFARQAPAQKRLTDLNTLANNVCQLRFSGVSERIALVRDLQPDLPLVLGDDNHLLQVFLHILNNAIEAVQECGSGEIVVRSRSAEEQVMIEICDNGPGIAEPSRVFDPFYTTKPLGQGTGLGLSACYGIVQEHEGKIECFNLSPHGAMFRVSFKIAGKTVEGAREMHPVL
ncbi:MAG TPA: ATP-binding protein [Terriglobales bacterium]|nr:ATP-binding protein [Terriglobales bacterium]